MPSTLKTSHHQWENFEQPPTPNAVGVAGLSLPSQEAPRTRQRLTSRACHLVVGHRRHAGKDLEIGQTADPDDFPRCLNSGERCRRPLAWLFDFAQAGVVLPGKEGTNCFSEVEEKSGQIVAPVTRHRRV